MSPANFSKDSHLPSLLVLVSFRLLLATADCVLLEFVITPKAYGMQRRYARAKRAV